MLWSLTIPLFEAFLQNIAHFFGSSRSHHHSSHTHIGQYLNNSRWGEAHLVPKVNLELDKKCKEKKSLYCFADRNV
jgi:hypothetical protein